MTNQPDAYTLAAQAAADRARAEALQRGGAQPGPGLQSPMRRLSRNPAARWVLSGVLLAAGTALAVDYLNTGLKARLQNVVRIPGLNGGKTVAEDAAQVTAKPQAKIDEEITSPAKVEERRDLLTKGDDEIKQSIASLGEANYSVMSKISYRRINDHFGDLLANGLPVPRYQDLNDPDFGGVYQEFLAPPQPLAEGSEVTPFLMNNGRTVATTRDPSTGENWVWVKLGDGHYGSISQHDFSSLKRDTADN